MLVWVLMWGCLYVFVEMCVPVIQCARVCSGVCVHLCVHIGMSVQVCTGVQGGVCLCAAGWGYMLGLKSNLGLYKKVMKNPNLISTQQRGGQPLPCLPQGLYPPQDHCFSFLSLL